MMLSDGRNRNATATTWSPSNPSFIKCAGLVVTTPAIAGVFFLSDCVTSAEPPNIKTVPGS